MVLKSIKLVILLVAHCSAIRGADRIATIVSLVTTPRTDTIGSPNPTRNVSPESDQCPRGQHSATRGGRGCQGRGDGVRQSVVVPAKHRLTADGTLLVLCPVRPNHRGVATSAERVVVPADGSVGCRGVADRASVKDLDIGHTKCAGGVGCYCICMAYGGHSCILQTWSAHRWMRSGIFQNRIEKTSPFFYFRIYQKWIEVL